MSDTLARAGAGRSFRYLATALRPRWPLLTAVVTIGLITAIAGLAGPWVVGRLVDTLTAGSSFAPVARYAAVVLVAGAVAGLGTWAGAKLLASALEPAIAGLREHVLAAGLDIDTQTVEKAGRGDLVSRIADDSREISHAATTVVPLVVQSLFTVIVSAVGMMSVDWRLGIIGLVAVPLYWSTLRAYLPRSGPLYRREREAFGVRTQRLLGGVGGAATLRAFAAEDTELRRINDASARARDLSISVFRFLTWAFSRNNRAEAITLVLILCVGFLLVDSGELTAGAVSTAALIFHRLFGPIGTLVGMFDQVQSAAASLVRMVGVIDAVGSVGRPPRREPDPTAGIHLTAVTHRYDPDRAVVEDLDLLIHPGERVAMVGATGAGKSTVALIAAGLLTPTEGTVRVAGVPAPDLDPAQLRGVVAMVSQEVHCFRGSVLDNVRIARPTADDAEAAAALTAVGADRWLDALAEGAETVIGDGGHRLTPVQEQMVALARVELADPDFVILDEATAESGSGGAGDLDAAAEVVLRDRGALIIAHRLNQAAAADRVLVMGEGRIIESGTHEELRSGGGLYSRLWAAWRGEESH